MREVLRVVQWNVRRCRDLSDECSVARVVRTIRSLQPNLLSLNELDVAATPSLLHQLSASCGLEHTSFFGHVRGTYGNALLSTEPLSDIQHLHLDGGTTVVARDGRTHRIARGMLGATVNVLGVAVRLAVTHLDHICDKERRIQLDHALRSLNSSSMVADRPSHLQHFIIGDLNALDRHDYTDEEWAVHEANNQQRGWAPPTDAAANGGSLWRLREAGFTDAFGALMSQPSRRPASLPWTAHLRMEQGPRYRIDYVWSRPPASGPQLVPRTAFV